MPPSAASIKHDGADKCAVCTMADAKYTCPQCRITRVCSVSCSKQHRADCDHQSANNHQRPSQEITAAELNKVATASSSTSNSSSSPNVAAAPLDINQALARIPVSAYMMRALQHPELRAIITSIDRSSQRSHDLDQHRLNNEAFNEFIESLLKLLTCKEDELAAFEANAATTNKQRAVDAPIAKELLDLDRVVGLLQESMQ